MADIITNETKTKRKAKWKLKIPSFEGGELNAAVFNCGAGMEDDIISKTTFEDSLMQTVSNTTPELFKAYLTKLEENGYTRDFYNEIEDNAYARYTLKKSTVYTYFTGNDGVTRVIDDKSSNTTVSEIIAKANVNPSANPVEFYQYAIDYTQGEERSEKGINCGMFYIIKLADSSLFLIDGGHKLQASAEAIKSMYEFLYKVSGKEKKQKLDIAAWYITHAHGDHVTVCFALLDYMRRRTAGLPRIGSFLFNFPSESNIGQAFETAIMRTRIKAYYPKMKYLKIFTGMTLDYPGVKLDVVYSHESAFDGEKLLVRSENDACTVVSLTFDGFRLMMLGDVNINAQNVIMPMYSEEYFKSDAVQPAHHTFNRDAELYRAINAPIAIVPQSLANALCSNAGINEFTKYASDANIYYSDKYTFKFVYDGSKLNVTSFKKYDEK